MTSLLVEYTSGTGQSELLEYKDEIITGKGGGGPEDDSEDDSEDDLEDDLAFIKFAVTAGSEGGEPDSIVFMDPMGSDSLQIPKNYKNFVLEPQLHTKGGNSFRDALSAEEPDYGTEEPELKSPERREQNVNNNLSKYIKGGVPPRKAEDFTDKPDGK
jgi:hypothetical protein